METNLYFWGTTEQEYLNTFHGFYKKYPDIVRFATGCSSLIELDSYVKTYFELFHKNGCFNAFEILGKYIGHIHNLESHLQLEGDQPINVWNEETQDFETVSLKKLFDTLSER